MMEGAELCFEGWSGSIHMRTENLYPGLARRVFSRIPPIGERIDWERFSDRKGKPSAVLVPFFPKGDELHLLLLERSAALRRHPGQIAFPGGAREESDRGPVDTALRETTEETGISGDAVEVLGILPEVHAFSSDFVLFPVVGFIPYDVFSEGITPDPAEVQRVLDVPFRSLGNSPKWETFNRKGKVLKYPVFPLDDDVIIWGATAWILWNLIRIIDGAVPERTECP